MSLLQHQLIINLKSKESQTRLQIPLYIEDETEIPDKLTDIGIMYPDFDLTSVYLYPKPIRLPKFMWRLKYDSSNKMENRKK